MTWLLALLGVPLTIELVGRLLAVRDAWPVPRERPPALQRLATPLLVSIIVLWIAPPETWYALALGAGFVAGWRMLTWAMLRLVMRSRRFHMRVIDTDDA